MTKDTLITLHPSFDAKADTTQDMSHYWSQQLSSKQIEGNATQQAMINAGTAIAPADMLNEQKSMHTEANIYGEYRYIGKE